jgi:hypothetical protein
MLVLACFVGAAAAASQRNCPKYVDFHSKNKFEKLVHLVGFIIGIHNDTLLVGNRMINYEGFFW